MAKLKNIFMAIAIVILTLQASMAQIQGDGKAGLVITPTRVELEGKQRSAAITIANNGTTKGSYRILTVNKKMTEDGKLVEVVPEDDVGMFADEMLRISPRSVTIEPGDNQSVRILVRKPKDLAEGEYRTHLSVMIMPDDVPVEDKEVGEDKLSIAIKANYGVTIPLIVRHGNVTATAEMGEISFVPAKDKNEKDAVKFTVKRNGNGSVYGDVKIILQTSKGEEKTIKFMGGLAIYTPNKQRDFLIPLDEEAVKAGTGTLKVVYQEKEKAGGKVIAEGKLKL